MFQPTPKTKQNQLYIHISTHRIPLPSYGVMNDVSNGTLSLLYLERVIIVIIEEHFGFGVVLNKQNVSMFCSCYYNS